MFSGLELTIVFLAAAVLGVVVFRYFHLPPILGYLTVGIVIGPHALGFVDENHTTGALAEFGIVFLMFSIGLEFSLPKLSSIKGIVFGLGVTQVLLSIVVTMLFGWAITYFLPDFAQISWAAAFALGATLSLSSTAIVMKILTEKMALETSHGRRIVGILLFQDLALVPLLIIVSAVGGSNTALWETLLWAGAKAVFVLFLLLVIGKRLMRGWLKIVVNRRSQELFMLNLLLMTLGAAWITEHAGLSLALGSFVAGMLVSETEFKHQVEEDIRSFRDVLLGLFFITIGMLLNVPLVLANIALVLFFLLFPLVLKFLIVAALVRFSGSSPAVAIRTGLSLAQSGEFGFVLLNQAGSSNLLDPVLVQILLASMVLSMLATPFMLNHADKLVALILRKSYVPDAETQPAICTKKQHVVIAGFGRSGQKVAKLLTEENISYQALDLNLEHIGKAQAAGFSVMYGDATRRESLLFAGITHAAALVITAIDTPSILKILHHAKTLHPALPIVVRSHDDSDLDQLRAAGATEIVPEAMEGSLMLASHALVLVGVPLRRVVRRVQTIRDARYTSLRGYFHSAEDLDRDDRLHSIILREQAQAIGKSLSTLALQENCAQIIFIRRNGQTLAVDDTTVFAQEDVLVLRGTAETIALTEAKLA